MKNNKILSEADYIAKEHYKMYKAGKKWMVAGITAVSILGAVAMAEGTASADQVANTTSGTDPAVVKVDETAATSQSATTVTLSASASVSSVASEVPAVTEISASSEVVSSVVASEAVSSSSDVESSVAPASVSASVEASSSVSASVTPVASVSASVESSMVVESSSVVESVASSVAPVVNGHDSVAMSSMMSSAESAKAAGSIVAMKAVLGTTPAAGTVTNSGIASMSNVNHVVTITDPKQAPSYFTPTGSGITVKPDATGKYTLTNGGKQTGAIAFNNQVDMSDNWSFDVTMDLPDVNHDSVQKGDFIGVVLTPTAPDKVATAADASLGGGGLGIAGSKNAYVWGLDYYYNAESQFGDANNTVKSTSSWGKTTINEYGLQVGLRRTDGSGKLVAAGSMGDVAAKMTTAGGSTVSLGSNGTVLVRTTHMGETENHSSTFNGSMIGLSTLGDERILNASTGADRNVTGDPSTYNSSTQDNVAFKSTATFSWNATTKILTVVMGSQTFTYDMSKQNLPSVLSVGVLSSTGGNYTTNNVQIAKFTGKVATTNVKASYNLNGDTTSVAGTSFTANVGDSIKIDNTAETSSIDGATITAAAPKVAGYTLTGYVFKDATGKAVNTVVLNADGSVKSGDATQKISDGLTVTFNYGKNVSATVNITDAAGNILSKDAATVSTLAGNTVANGDVAFTLDNLPQIPGYKALPVTVSTFNNTVVNGGETINVVYVKDASAAPVNDTTVDVSSEPSVIAAQKDLDSAIASGTGLTDAEKAYDTAVAKAATEREAATTAASDFAPYPANLENDAITSAKQAVADAVAGLGNGKTTADINTALTDYAKAIQSAVADDAAKLASTTEASDATVKADKGVLDTKLADLATALKSGDQARINAATKAVTDAKNALDKAVQAAANTNANGVADLKDANLTGLQTALQDATKAGTIADIAAKEASLVDGVKNTANTLLDQVTADQAAVTSANDDATKTAASDLDGAKVELQNVLAAVPAASVAAIVTAVKALDDKKRAYESAVKNAVTLNDDTKAVAGLAASDAAVNTAVTALKKALTDGTLTDLATAESGLKSAINAAATAAGNTADAEQDVVAKMSVAKDADVTAAGTILDQTTLSWQRLLSQAQQRQMRLQLQLRQLITPRTTTMLRLSQLLRRTTLLTTYLLWQLLVQQSRQLLTV
ncbi:KxYKxGKxW signal peptide domain-containing protein [Weissella cibaria]|uniref:KxYKxGKxW signal peptide domain-containing protein n=1 Tax=Weissella cibaria TaxID=137591 RepID=UPI00288084B1|nr:KxYKxGKxW signal peptide domain-containing protein [Weissella cibaria]MCT0021491.1 hypothetical protein [Weissella cibaria]